jgi:G:T/U-mismatch repair DNA glycosylase
VDDKPRSLREKQNVVQRSVDLQQKPDMARLVKFVKSLRREAVKERVIIPDFDPWDGGASAGALFLMEKPSKVAAASGFVSRNNDDRTAENIFNLMIEADIRREKICMWNVVPGWNDKRKVESAELDAGVQSLKELFPLLPNLKVVVFVGQKAARALPLLQGTSIKIYQSPHPSPQVKGRYRDQWNSIPVIWRRVREFLD